MEYTIDKLDEAICYYLSLHRDELISIDNIYKDLCADNICPSLNNWITRDVHKLKFTTLCHIIDTKIEGIHKIYKGSHLFLIMTNKPLNEIEKQAHYILVPPTSILSSSDNVIENLMSDGNWKKKFPYTVLKLACNKKDRELIRNIINSVDIDDCLNTNERSKLFEQLPKDEEGFSLLTDIMTYNYDKKIGQFSNENDKVRYKYEKLCDETNKLQSEIEKCRKDLTDTNKQIVFLVIFCFLFFSLYMVKLFS